MLKIKALLIITISFLLLGCGDNIKTTNDFRPGTQFSAFKTYAYLPFENDALQTIDQDRIKAALTAELAEKDLIVADSTEADVLIAYHVFTEIKQKQRVTSTGGSYYYGRRYYGPTISMGTTYVDNIDYKVGNLVVDFIAPNNRQILYHAEASTNVGDVKTPEDRSLLIREAVKKMLEEYPPAMTKLTEK